MAKWEEMGENGTKLDEIGRNQFGCKWAPLLLPFGAPKGRRVPASTKLQHKSTMARTFARTQQLCRLAQNTPRGQSVQRRL